MEESIERTVIIKEKDSKGQIKSKPNPKYESLSFIRSNINKILIEIYEIFNMISHITRATEADLLINSIKSQKVSSVFAEESKGDDKIAVPACVYADEYQMVYVPPQSRKLEVKIKTIIKNHCKRIKLLKSVRLRYFLIFYTYFE